MTNCKAEKKGSKNMSEKDQKAYYAVIPANVRYDKRLKANEKLLYGEITALTNERGYCWAGNKYFSDLYGVTPQAVSKWINGLKDCGYISIEYTYRNGTKEIESRIIKLVSTNVSEVSTNVSEVSTNVSEGINKCFRGYKQKVKDNNTCLNNTVNNTNEHINTKVSKKEENNNTQNRQVEISEELKQMQKEIEQLKAENEKLKTKKKKPKKQTKSYDEQIAEYTENEELQNALKAFVQMRSFIKKPMTEYALKLMLKKLDELGNNDTAKIAILNQSITHNWQGIFPLKNEYTNQEKQPEKKYDQNGYESEEELMKMLYGK
jgi:hypothetical protein